MSTDRDTSLAELVAENEQLHDKLDSLRGERKLKTPAGRTKRLIVLVAVGTMVTGLGLWHWGGLWYAYWRTLPETEIATVKSFGEVLAGLLAVIGILLLFYRTWVADRQAATATKQAATAAKQADLVERGQVTDRFTKAIGQLGDDKRAIRLGGIYSLEQIAIDSEEDRRMIVEMMCAFIRDWGAPSKINEQSSGDEQPSSDEQPSGHTEKMPPPQGLPTDVQATLSVLVDKARGNDLQNRHPNLSGAHLHGAKLISAYLGGADLTGAHLASADLNGADLMSAQLEGVDLRGADLGRARLSAAHLRGADLRDRQATAH